ncbi:F-box protein CPR1-like [Alnus glutinosa]|uniref:F-box protein CPR1-like n=1 Tax=Alnus glutinosa TaxID=3517 RepID=UPI002D78FF20|nr:F-box protein CPR1-like [Alnus glutinosa]
MDGNMSTVLLPQDLIAEIFSPLSIKSLVRFQCVSKPCCALINDPYFINMHLNAASRERSLIVETCRRHWPKDYYSVNFSDEDRSFGERVKIFPPFIWRQENLNHPSASVIGCCNSLVCIRKYDDEVVIWNPSIKKYKKLPNEPDLDHDKHSQIISAFGYDPVRLNLAFGFDPVNNDYKVLKIVFVESVKPDNWGLEPQWAIEIMDPIEIMVYSLKSHSWRRVEDQWPYKEESFICSGPPAFSNGVFHWLVMSAPGVRTLLTFDLTTEKFGVQTFPFESYLNVAFEVLGGSLCVSGNTADMGVEVWMMNGHGVASSWSRLYTIPMTFRYSRSLALSKDGEKVLIEDESNKLFWYNIKENTCCRIVDQNNKHTFIKYWTASYVESLLLLDGDNGN